MRFITRLAYAFGQWRHTTLGPMPVAGFTVAAGSPCNRLLDLALQSGNGTAVLTRLAERRAYAEARIDSHLDQMLDQMRRSVADTTTYGHELNGVPIADILVTTLTVWAVERFDIRVVLAPEPHVVFRIAPASAVSAGHRG